MTEKHKYVQAVGFIATGTNLLTGETVKQIIETPPGDDGQPVPTTGYYLAAALDAVAKRNGLPLLVTKIEAIKYELEVVFERPNDTN